MRLRIDTRLPHDLVDVSADDPPEIQRNRAIYRITEVLIETPWHALYRAKKVFHNFDFKDRRIVEVDDDECLDVFVKTLAYPTLDQRAYVTARRDLAWFEAKKVMGCRKTNLIPEPLGFLEVRNDQDIFSFPRAGQISAKEPILISEAIHGETLARWRQHRQPDLPQILRVLSELLELIQTFHAERMLVNNVGPATFWIDSAHRVHFVGTENVVEATKAAAVRFLFPPERYARGFAAPELGNIATAPSMESDLYGWAAVAYFLITGDSPARVAADQQQSWARFESRHRQVLREALLYLSDGQIRDVQQWLGVEGGRFRATWPDGLVDGLFACLDPDPTLRPPDVGGLRNWWAKAPPPRVPFALGVVRANGRVQLTFSNAGLAHSLMYSIRRKSGGPPRVPTDGTEVWKGTFPGRIEDVWPKSKGTAETFHYSVFTLDVADGNTASSLASPVTLLDGTTPDFCQHFAEQVVATSPRVGNVIPMPVAELEALAAFETLPFVAASLFKSAEAQIRSWAVRLLDQRLQNSPGDQACRDLLLQRGLHDVHYPVRRESAAVLVKTAVKCDVQFVVKVLAPALGGEGLDDRIRAVRGMGSIGLDDGLVQAAIQTFELNRPVECAECHLHFRAGDIDEHLIQSHDYVPIDGDVLPLRAALKKLWEGVLLRVDPAAFRELVRQLARRQAGNTVEALRASFRQRFLLVHETGWHHLTSGQTADYVANLARCLAADPRGEELCCHLLVDEDPRLNQLGQQFFLQRAAQELVGEEISVAKFRQWLEFLVPREQSAERLRMCDALVAWGANATVAQAIRQELELNRLTLCPECGESLQARALGRHRRRRHQIFEFENQRYSLDGLARELVTRLISPEANLYTAMTLVELHEEQFGDAALVKLIELLSHTARSVADRETLSRSLMSAASSLAPLPSAPRLCQQVLKSDQTELIELGLLLFGHLTKLPDPDLARRVAGLVGSIDVSLPARSLATVALVRWSANWPEVCRKALMIFAAGISSDSLEKIDALQTLESRTGESKLIQEACRELAESRRIRCPKCGEVLTGREMPQHALEQHHRVFDGRNLRRPWSVALECLETYASHPDAALLKRAEDLSQVEDTRNGRLRLIREALKRGIDPGHYRRTLEDADPEGHHSICPTCFDWVPRRQMMHVDCAEEGQLESPLLSIRRLGRSPFWWSALIEGTSSAWNGLQPEWSLTKLGAAGAILGLTWTPALGILLLSQLVGGAGTQIAATIFVLGGLLSAIVAFAYRPKYAHVIDVAWGIVVPDLLNSELNEQAESFIAGLCVASIGRGYRIRRRPIVAALLEKLTVRYSMGQASHVCLGALHSLQWHDAYHQGTSEPMILNLIVPVIRTAFSGSVPLSVLDLAAADGGFFGLLSAEANIALRWRVLQLARTLEWSFADVLAAARHSKAIKTLVSPPLGSIQDKLAEAWSILEVAADPHQLPAGTLTGADFAERGDLKPFRKDIDLLAQSPDSKVRLCSRGLFINETCHTLPPRITTRTLTRYIQTGWTYQKKGGGPDLRYKHNPPVGYEKTLGYELTVSGKSEKWSTDPTIYATQLRAFSEILFNQVKSRARTAASGRPTFHTKELLRARPVICQSCGQMLIHGPGHFAGVAD